MQDKEKVNSGNKYSHNFFGLYCTCDRPYPDPEDEVMCVLVAFYNVFLSPVVLLSDHILYCILFKIINLYSNLNSACNKILYVWSRRVGLTVFTLYSGVHIRDWK